jgi:hypothetical protein
LVLFTSARARPAPNPNAEKLSKPILAAWALKHGKGIIDGVAVPGNAGVEKLSEGDTVRAE